MVSGNVTVKKRPSQANLRPLAIRLAMPPAESIEKLAQLEVHLFDDRRRHIGTAPLREQRAELDAPVAHTRYVRAVIAPRGMPPDAVQQNTALPSLALETRELKMLEFPAGWWQNFVLGQPILYRGHVEKVVGTGTLPICEGTVEVYEVDAYHWIWKLPEFELLRVRDELLARLRGELLTPIPRPTPGPGPIARAELGTSLVRAATARTTIHATNELRATASLGNTATRTLSNVDLSQLERLEGLELRNSLFLYREALLPYLCLMPWPWYSLSKLGEVAIRADGTFFGFAGWWLPGQDRPDLYFRVRQTIEGTPRTIYSPPVAWSTWWDYAGQDVPIRVTDPEAIACCDPLVAQDDQIVFLGLGFDTTTDAPTAQGLVQTGSDLGLYRYANGKLGPYASRLHVALDVDLAGLDAAGLRYFRLSYRSGVQNSIGAESDWTPLVTPLNRHYRQVIGGNVSYPTLSLVPTAGSVPAPLAAVGGVFRFPEPGREYVVIDAADRAFGVWDTDALVDASHTEADVAGPYTVRVQIFDQAGNDVTASTPVLRISDRQLDGSYTTSALAASKPFLFVHVDGRAMEAEIRDVIEAGQTTTGTGCGFLVANPDADVEVFVKAYHPGGVGVPGDPDRFLDSWHYTIQRGASATTMVDYSVSNANAGSPTNYYALPDAGVPAQRVDDLLAGVAGGPNVQRRCTFDVDLRVYTLTRDGYSVRTDRHRYDSASFALIDRSTVA
ncbi:MAG: hypothetical protein HZA52_17525 [Planctomycetes bacterium]|nr:hypothetical protein [Planctomycetota bacterium]